MSDELFVGLDLGTTGMKVGLFDASGRALAAASREFHLSTPAAGFAEFDADEYVARTFECVREVLSAPGVGADRVRAIGLSSQAQTFVVLGADGRPLRPAVSWLDVRAADEARALTALSRCRKGGEITAVASAPKLLWLRNHESDVMSRVRHVLLLPDYLIYRLTGCRMSDPVTAGSTSAFDVATGSWMAEILQACGLTTDMMPTVSTPGSPVGCLSADAARELGLPAKVLVAVGTNDQLAGALGAGNVEPGCASLALGTALAIIATAGAAGQLPRGVGSFPHPAGSTEKPDLSAILAYAKTTGIVVRWFRDNFAPSLSYDELFAEAGSVEVGAGGVTCVPHFSGSATPDFRSSVRGAFVGIDLTHRRAHLARALAESLAFTVRQNLELLAPAVHVQKLRAIGGGAKSDLWLQIIADVTGVVVERAKVTEAACLGAAELAMAAAGTLGTVGEISRRLYRSSRSFRPDSTVRSDYDRAYARYGSVYEALYRKDGEEDAHG